MSSFSLLPEPDPKSGRSVHVLVGDETGKAIAGVIVRFVDAFSNVRASLGQVTTGEQGARIQFAKLGGSLLVEAMYGPQSEEAEVAPLQSEVRFTFKRLHSFKPKGPPVAQCPDGKTGQPCVDCLIGGQIIRICA